ncbi:MAG: nickel-dependent hydrogenase large subunit [Polyangiales bacterium]
MPSELDTAAHPEGLRRVVIEPVTRVEGHGKVTLLLDEANRVRQVRLHIVEFRGFERFIRGRPYWEVPVMVQRLCGICPVSHHLAASKALDAVVGARVDADRRPHPPADALRPGAQSAAPHLYHLAARPLWLRRRPGAAVSGAVPSAPSPTSRARGSCWRKYGQEAIHRRQAGARHGLDPRRRTAVTPAERDQLRALSRTCSRGRSRACVRSRPSIGRTRTCTSPSGACARACSPGHRRDGALDLYDGVLRAAWRTPTARRSSTTSRPGTTTP